MSGGRENDVEMKPLYCWGIFSPKDPLYAESCGEMEAESIVDVLRAVISEHFNAKNLEICVNSSGDVYGAFTVVDGREIEFTGKSSGASLCIELDDYKIEIVKY